MAPEMRVRFGVEGATESMLDVSLESKEAEAEFGSTEDKNIMYWISKE